MGSSLRTSDLGPLPPRHSAMPFGLPDVLGGSLDRLGDRLTRQQMTIRILNGGNNMPAFAAILTPQEVDSLVAFLETRKEAGTSDLPRSAAAGGETGGGEP